jgi:ABC-type transport system involved in multi-copper enzyme maturation permease subunit
LRIVRNIGARIPKDEKDLGEHGMAARWGFGPVFAAECLTTSRRWQVYAGRALLVGSLVCALVLIWLAEIGARGFMSVQDYSPAIVATLGIVLVDTIIAVELVLAIVVVPAVTAGAICQDKMQGGLTLMMVTDLSDAEIVLGKLASRLVTVVGVVACGLPVLAIMTALGGVDPLAIVSGSMVIVAMAVLGVSLSLTFSVWATKPHEALMATYATYAVWLLALLAWLETFNRAWVPDVLYVTNPFWLLFRSRWSNGAAPILASAGFLIGALLVSALLAAISTWRIRAVTLRQAARPARRERTLVRWFRHRGASLDFDPILWLEMHRRQPSSWGRAIWRLYAVVSTMFVVLAIVVNRNIAAGVSGFMVSIGLLMISVTSATSLAEERAHGSLDLLLTTPLSARAIISGKWRGTFRAVKRLAVLPGVLAFFTALTFGRVAAVFGALLIVALVLAYGAVITSLGQFLALRQPRLGRAVGFSVAAYLAMTVVYPTVVLTAVPINPLGGLVLLCASPFFGMFTPMAWLVWLRPSVGVVEFLAMIVWVVFLAAVAYFVFRATLRSFDRRVGRVPSAGKPDFQGPLSKSRRRAPLATVLEEV